MIIVIGHLVLIWPRQLLGLKVVLVLVSKHNTYNSFVASTESRATRKGASASPGVSLLKELMEIVPFVPRLLASTAQKANL
jgi:hypothetical protein